MKIEKEEETTEIQKDENREGGGEHRYTNG